MTVYDLICELEMLADDGYGFNQVEIGSVGSLIGVFKFDDADPKSPIMLMGT